MTQAQTYTTSNPNFFDQIFRRQKAHQVLKLLRIHLKAKNIATYSVLSDGCGTGYIPYYLSSCVGKVEAIDINPLFIHEAKSKFKKANLTYRVMDGENLRFPDNSFDMVICNQVLNWTTNPNKFLKEVLRVLRPHGICYLANENKFVFRAGQYQLPFLTLLPKKVAFWYIRHARGIQPSYFSYLTFWELTKLCSQFTIHRYTPEILHNLRKFHFVHFYFLEAFLSNIPLFLLKSFLPFISPNFIWILEKPA